MIGEVEDPRPDLTDDHDLWIGVLGRVAWAYGTDGDGLYWALRGARAIGAELLFVDGDHLRLRSRPGTEIDYEAVRQHLLPHATALTAILTGKT